MKPKAILQSLLWYSKIQSNCLKAFSIFSLCGRKNINTSEIQGNTSHFSLENLYKTCISHAHRFATANFITVTRHDILKNYLSYSFYFKNVKMYFSINLKDESILTNYFNFNTLYYNNSVQFYITQYFNNIPNINYSKQVNLCKSHIQNEIFKIYKIVRQNKVNKLLCTFLFISVIVIIPYAHTSVANKYKSQIRIQKLDISPTITLVSKWAFYDPLVITKTIFVQQKIGI